jgi:hypothetical protein
MEDVPNVIYVRMVDKKNVHASGRAKPGIGGAIHCASRRYQDPHSRWIFKQQRPVPDAELAGGSAEGSDDDVLSQSGRESETYHEH